MALYKTILIIPTTVEFLRTETSSKGPPYSEGL